MIGPPEPSLTDRVGPLHYIDDLTPHTRVATAILPFLFSIVMRLFFGKNKFTRILLSLATTWFAINVLLAPYSDRMQVEIRSLGYRMFR